MAPEGVSDYASWLPGPWLDRTRYGDAEETNEFIAVCEICGRVVRLAFDEDDEEGCKAEWQRASDSAREDWENHVGSVDPNAVPFYLLPGVGRGKTARLGRWADVIRAIPLLLMDGDPVPPHAVVNAVLVTGTDHGGMSGGCEWPRHELTRAEYRQLRADLVDAGSVVDLDSPEWVTTPDDFSVWRVVAKVGCSPAAVRAWHDELQSAKGGAPFNWLHSHRDEWLRDFDAQHDD